MFRKQVCREGEKLFHVFEHGDGVLFLNRVGNDNAAHVEAVFIRKAVLQFPQPVAVPVAQFQRGRLDVDVDDIVMAVNITGDREQKRRT